MGVLLVVSRSDFGTMLPHKEVGLRKAVEEKEMFMMGREVAGKQHSPCTRSDGLRYRGKGGVAVLSAVVLVGSLGAAARADEIELTNGKRYPGRVIDRTKQVVTFKIVFPSGGAAQTEFDVHSIKSLKIDGTEPVFKPPASQPGRRPAPPEQKPPTAVSTKPSPPDQRGRPKAEIEAMIRVAGKTPPPWWDSIELDYPQTLDLRGTHKAPGWAPQRNLGAYLISVVNPNPATWRPTVKLLHTVLKARKDDPPRLREAMAMLARCYHRFLKDWPRAAFWWQKTIAAGDRPSLQSVVGLAECYFKLGSRPAAAAILKKYGLDRLDHGLCIKLWADMGEYRKALQLTEGLSRSRPADGYLAAGNVCRAAGRYQEALACYKKVLAAGGRNQRNQQRAQASIEAIRLYESLDLGQVPDGTYTGSGVGYRGPVEVAVEVKDGKIVSARVTRHREDMPLTSVTDIPEQIVDKQGVNRIDAVTAATISSEAIVHGAAEALAGARE